MLRELEQVAGLEVCDCIPFISHRHKPTYCESLGVDQPKSVPNRTVGNIDSEQTPLRKVPREPAWEP